MRHLALLPLLSLAACAAVPPMQEVPLVGAAEGSKCDSAPAQHFIGQIASQDAGSQIAAQTHSSALRWVPMGMMVTMDFRENRVNVRLDRANQMLSISCG